MKTKALFFTIAGEMEDHQVRCNNNAGQHRLLGRVATNLLSRASENSTHREWQQIFGQSGMLASVSSMSPLEDSPCGGLTRASSVSLDSTDPLQLPGRETKGSSTDDILGQIQRGY